MRMQVFGHISTLIIFGFFIISRLTVTVLVCKYLIISTHSDIESNL